MISRSRWWCSRTNTRWMSRLVWSPHCRLNCLSRIAANTSNNAKLRNKSSKQLRWRGRLRCQAYTRMKVESFWNFRRESISWRTNWECITPKMQFCRVSLRNSSPPTPAYHCNWMSVCNLLSMCVVNWNSYRMSNSPMLRISWICRPLTTNWPNWPRCKILSCSSKSNWSTVNRISCSNSIKWLSTWMATSSSSTTRSINRASNCPYCPWNHRGPSSRSRTSWWAKSLGESWRT